MNKEIEVLAEELGAILKRKHLKLATAESCTGGGLGFALTAIAGSSDWFERGFITYSNDAKIELLGVKPQTLDTFGAVSAETAREMAAGALAHSRADISVSITGIAGPDGGTADKPVGTVWMAFAGKNLSTDTEVNIFPGDRRAVREATIQRALQHLITFTTV
jgi:nicotinamide-nucleotide amidase